MTRAASASSFAKTLRSMHDYIRHRRRMIVWKPVDYILSVTDIDKRIARFTSFELSKARLLGLIFIRPQVSIRWILRFCDFTRFASLIETVSPDRFVCEFDRGESELRVWSSRLDGGCRLCIVRYRSV